MIKRKKQYVSVFGSSVLLIGTYHSPFDDLKKMPENTELYQTIENFTPDIILIEKEGYDEHGKIKDEVKIRDPYNTDIKIINRYANNNQIERVPYDKELHNDLEEYDNIVSTKMHQKLSEAEPAEKRSIIRQINKDMYWDLFEYREDHACKVITNYIKDYNKIAIHCGVSHFSAYANFLDEIRDIYYTNK